MLSQSASMWTTWTTSRLCRARQKKRHVIDFPHSQQNDFAMQGKYTASHSNFSKIHTRTVTHTHTHNRISAELYLATAYKQNFFSPSCLAQNNMRACLKKKTPMHVYARIHRVKSEERNTSKCDMICAVNKNHPASEQSPSQ